jgi:hypothetical protein
VDPERVHLPGEQREEDARDRLTTHSPYVLEELPLDARAYILQLDAGERAIVYGVSPDLAMTRMDEAPHPEIDVFVEDRRAAQLLTELLVTAKPDLVRRCQLIQCGGSSVLKTLGQLIADKRLPRASIAVVDGDVGATAGCLVLPGLDAPERVIFNALKVAGWDGVARRIGRPVADVADACNRAMTDPDHHVWVNTAASVLVLGGDNLWQAMCAEWTTVHLPKGEAISVAQAVEDALIGVVPGGPSPVPISTSRPGFGAVMPSAKGPGPSATKSAAASQAPLFDEK